ncbi:MAG: TlpA disulfide reductase family protein [Granulosicoccaceae bacterium]|jgi:thiol-disulfide isomerase/thioredoxin
MHSISRFTRQWLTLLLSFALLAGTASLAAAAGLSSLDGKPDSLDNYIGKNKWTVVMVWASDCHVCNTEAHEYVAFQSRRPDIQMLGLTLDGEANKAAALEFVKEHKLNFPNLIGEPETIAGLYYELTGNFFMGTPTFLIYTPQGKLTAADVGAIPVEIIEDFIDSQAVATSGP